MQTTEYELRDRINQLAAYRGEGTELITIVVPPDKSLRTVRERITREYAQAANIKSDQTRTHVQDALGRIRCLLDAYEETPPNGLVIYAGVVDGELQDAVFDNLDIPVDVSWVRIGFAIAWPLLITALCLSVFVSLRGRPRPVGRERLVIVGGVLSQLLSLLTASYVITHGRSVLENPLEVIVRPLPIMAVALVVFVSIIPDIDRYENETGLNWVFPTYLLGMGVLAASGAAVWSSLGTFRTFLWVLTVACILGGSALWIVRYFDL